MLKLFIELIWLLVQKPLWVPVCDLLGVSEYEIPGVRPLQLEYG